MKGSTYTNITKGSAFSTAISNHLLSLDMDKEKLSLRPLEEEDLKMLKEWWDFWRFPMPPRQMLPDNLKENGVMVMHDGLPVCAGFIYGTSASATFMLEFIVSNPFVKDRGIRKLCLKTLIKSVAEITKSYGGLVLYSTLANRNLIKTYEECGFTKGTTAYEMIMITQ